MANQSGTEAAAIVQQLRSLSSTCSQECAPHERREVFLLQCKCWICVACNETETVNASRCMRTLLRNEMDPLAPDVQSDCVLSANASRLDAFLELSLQVSDTCVACPHFEYRDNKSFECRPFEDTTIRYSQAEIIALLLVLLIGGLLLLPHSM